MYAQVRCSCCCSTDEMNLSFQPRLCNVRRMQMTFLAQAATGKLIIDWNTILMAAMTMMTALGVPFIAYLVLKVKANSEKTAAALLVVSEKTDAVGVKTDKAVEVLNEVKMDVNSGRTKLEEKLTKVEEKLLVVTGEKATSDAKVVAEQDKAVTLAATKEAQA